MFHGSGDAVAQRGSPATASEQNEQFSQLSETSFPGHGEIAIVDAHRKLKSPRALAAVESNLSKSMTVLGNTPIRVLQVLPLFTSRAGGPVMAVSQASEALEGLGVYSTIISTTMGHVPSRRSKRRLAENEMPANYKVLDVRLFDVREPRRLAYSPKLGRYLRSTASQFDLLHIHSLWLYPQYAAFCAARSSGIPYVVSPRGALDPYLRQRGRLRKAITSVAWQKEMLEKASVIHVTTEREREVVADIAPGVRRVVIPNGVHIKNIAHTGSAKSFRQVHIGGETAPIILFLGRISRVKGLNVLVKAFANVIDSGIDARLVVAGPDDEGLSPGLVEQSRSLGVEERISFIGPVYGEDRADAMAAASVWVSTSFTESFGIAVVEALSSGLPSVIAPGVKIAEDARKADAAVVAELSPGAFGQAIRDLLNDPDRRVQLGRNATRFASRYDWQEVAPRLRTMYEGMLQNQV